MYNAIHYSENMILARIIQVIIFVLLQMGNNKRHLSLLEVIKGAISKHRGLANNTIFCRFLINWVINICKNIDPY